MEHANKATHLIERRGAHRRLATYTAGCHSRSVHKSKKHRQLSAEDMDRHMCEGMDEEMIIAIEQGQEDEEPDKDGILPRHKKCPFCLKLSANGPGHRRGNVPHHHLHCVEPTTLRARENLCMVVEEVASDFTNLVNRTFGKQWATDHLAKLREELQQLELESVLEMSKRSNAVT